MLRHTRITTTMLLATALGGACAPDADTDAADMASQDTAAVAPDRAAPFTIADAAFQTPESVLHDEQADVYLVSNINGGPLERDDNGFIARVRPDGSVEQLNWIDGAAENVTLNAPKGMAIIGDTLFVADIDTVRAFHRSNGTPLGARAVAGVSFLNDLTAQDGVLYVTDTGVDAAFASTGTEAIHRFDGGGASAVASGTELAGPNGIAFRSGELLMAPFGGNAIWRIPLDGGAPEQIATLPAGGLDGLVVLDDGSLLVSSWEGQAVYRVSADGQATAIAENIEAPADIGWDASRRRVLIPLFMGNAIEVREVR